jgi:threonine dehydratase
MPSTEPTLDIIRQAHARIRDHVLRTPLLWPAELSERLGTTLLLKCENMQYCGAFKSRGACNAVFSLSDDLAVRGVCAHSSGNHAAALARAARLRGISAHIVMPRNSRPNKIEAVRQLGVEPVFSGPSPDERQAVTNQLMAETGATLIHPYDDHRIIAGAATAALELLEQAFPPPDVLLVPLGGGGLLAGSLLTVKALAPQVQVIAAEPAWADDGFRSWKAGSIQQPTRYDTIADGLRTSLGERTFTIIQRLVDDIVLCSEAAIGEATDLLLNVAKIVVEPSGAVPLAAVLSDPDRFRGRRVALLVSGGNMSAQRTWP